MALDHAVLRRFIGAYGLEQQRRKRPPFGNGEWRHLLICTDEATQDGVIERHVALRHQRARERVDARSSLRGTRCELWEVTDELTRELLLDLSRDAANQVVVVKKPLGRLGSVRSPSEFTAKYLRARSRGRANRGGSKTWLTNRRTRSRCRCAWARARAAVSSATAVAAFDGTPASAATVTRSPRRS